MWSYQWMVNITHVDNKGKQHYFMKWGLGSVDTNAGARHYKTTVGKYRFLHFVLDMLR